MIKITSYLGFSIASVTKPNLSCSPSRVFFSSASDVYSTDIKVIRKEIINHKILIRKMESVMKSLDDYISDMTLSLQSSGWQINDKQAFNNHVKNLIHEQNNIH